jgi:uncharacterized membrane protein
MPGKISWKAVSLSRTTDALLHALWSAVRAAAAVAAGAAAAVMAGMAAMALLVFQAVEEGLSVMEQAAARPSVAAQVLRLVRLGHRMAAMVIATTVVTMATRVLAVVIVVSSTVPSMASEMMQTDIITALGVLVQSQGL